MNRLQSAFLILLFAALLAGCSMVNDHENDSSLLQTATYPAPITTEPFPPTNTPLPGDTPTPRPTPTPYQPIEGKILFDAMRLRRGPGFLFETTELYPIDQTVLLLGRAPGNNWLYVQTTDNQTGWMKVQGIELAGNLYDAPEVTPNDAVVVHGRVFAPNGSPASEIVVGVQPQGDDNPARQDVGVSDVTGRFYIYLPAGTSGKWILSASAYGCTGSSVNSACNLIGEFPPPQVITLPDAANAPIEIKLLP